MTISGRVDSLRTVKLKGEYGGPLLDRDIKDVEDLIPTVDEINLDSIYLEEEIKMGLISYYDLENLYIEAVNDSFNLKKLRENSSSFAFDAMYGSGQNVVKKLLPDIENCIVRLTRFSTEFPRNHFTGTLENSRK